MISLQPLIDLLLYHRQGDSNLFEKIVRQWFSIDANLTSHFQNDQGISYKVRSNLSALGFLETYHSKDVMKWSSIEPSVIKAKDTYILYLHQYQLNELPEDSYKLQKLFSIYDTTFLAPRSLEKIKWKGIPFIKPDFQQLINLLPHASTALDDQNICRRISELNHEMTLDAYDFGEEHWRSTSEITLRGLYRQKPDYGAYRYFIVDRYHLKEVYELMDKAWIYILAHEMLNHSIPIKFDSSKQQALIKPNYFYRLPSIFQRALISDSLKFPEYQQGHLILKDIDWNLLSKLKNKMNSLKVIRE